jgi:hypothetical protein
MSGFWGADVEAVRAHATACGRAAGRVEGLLGACAALVDGVEWTGPDADRFRERWSAEVRPLLERAISDLRADGEELDGHAEEQDGASGEAPVGPAAPLGPGPALPLGPTLPLPPIPALPAVPDPAMPARPLGPGIGILGTGSPLHELIRCDFGRDGELVPGILPELPDPIRCFLPPFAPTWPGGGLEPLPAPMPSPLPAPLPDVRPLPLPAPEGWPLPQPLPAPLPLPDPWPFPSVMPLPAIHRL